MVQSIRGSKSTMVARGYDIDTRMKIVAANSPIDPETLFF